MLRVQGMADALVHGVALVGGFEYMLPRSPLSERTKQKRCYEFSLPRGNSATSMARAADGDTEAHVEGGPPRAGGATDDRS